jgi:hypothetical protein
MNPRTPSQFVESSNAASCRSVVTVFILLGSLAAGFGGDDMTTGLIVSTWQRDSHASPSSIIAILVDGSFVSTFENTNHSVVLTYQGTWLVKNGELMMTITNVAGSMRHKPVDSIDRLRIVGLDRDHMSFAYQVAPNYFATNTYFRRP